MAERDLNSTRTQTFFGYKKSTARTGRNGLCYNRIAVLFFYITLWQQRMGHPPHGIPMCKLRHALVRLQWPVNLLLCPAVMLVCRGDLAGNENADKVRHAAQLGYAKLATQIFSQHAQPQRGRGPAGQSK